MQGLRRATGCAGQIGNNSKIKISGPGPTIAVGAGLVAGGTLIAAKTQLDDQNPYGTDPLFTTIGVGMMVVGVGAIVCGAYQMSAEQ